MKRILIIIISLLSLFTVPVSAARKEDVFIHSDFVDHLETYYAEIVRCHGQVGELTFSESYECYMLDTYNDLSLFEAYVGKGLEALYNEKEVSYKDQNPRLIMIYNDGKPLSFVVCRQMEDESWRFLPASESPQLTTVLQAKERLEQVVPKDTKISYLYHLGNLYLFTPELYNGYLTIGYAEKFLVPQDVYQSIQNDQTIYRTRDLLLEAYYDPPKPMDNVLEYNDAGEILPERHYPVWPFWLMVIGIPVAVIALSVGTVILVRKRKHAK